MRNVLFGSATAVLVYLFAFAITPSRRTALLAALLVATDPLHVVLSRHTFCEVYGTAFFVLAIVLYVRHNGRSLWLIMSALFMGLAAGTKWNYVPGWLLLYGIALYENANYRKISSALFVTSTYILIPLGIYILSFYQWFGRGYSFNEFIDFVSNIYYSFQSYVPEMYERGLVFLHNTKAMEWFVSPIIVGHGEYLAGGQGQFRLYVNNLPVWIFSIPALVGMTAAAIRKKSLTLALPAMLFCASYLLFLSVKRPAFLYSVIPLLPFAFTAIAYGIGRLADRFGVTIYYVALVSILSWNLFLYPLVTARKVPIALHRSVCRVH